MKNRFLAALICAVSANALAEGHLELGRSLVAEVTPENNRYTHNGWISWKGDRSLFGENTKTTVQTDCSGLITALLDRTNSSSLEIIKSKTYWRGRYPRAENYHEAISKGLGFETRTTIKEVAPGDIFAVKYLNSSADSGHVMLVDDEPKMVAPQEPFIPDTIQWSLTVIDSSIGAHGATDTRYSASEKITGVGRGTMRIYTDLAGVPVGYTWSVKSKKFYGVAERPMAFGKPD